MQVMSSSPSLSPAFNNFSGAGKFSYNFGLKLRLKEEEPDKEEEEKSNSQLEIGDEDEKEEEGDEEKLNSQPEIEDEYEKEEQSEEEGKEFSFVCLSPDGSPISADDLFQDGQIRHIFPLFNQGLLFADEDGTVLKTEEGDAALPPQVRKIFVEDSADATSSEPAGPFREWRGAKTVEEASPDTCRKSNSTGFSKLWRFRDLKLRCNSGGKTAFVFLSHPPPSSSSSSSSSVKTEKKTTLKAILEKPKVKTEKSNKMVLPPAHEKLYVKNRAQKEGIKRRPYLPYKQVGFFTNVNGLSRNVHPY
ncbi:uncharacterized protein LOC120149111 isoform X2 [Hibiscus syriacus]|uniref:uncharacterized protein LOC120149111 isoform X2 n=1 Tax=Hibiscus syriacus TaxID=106335 RepID=UPI001924E554|nr:uncharacterized protein LOC120149111 isoform X2 [Hibiscus syriacus]